MKTTYLKNTKSKKATETFITIQWSTLARKILSIWLEKRQYSPIFRISPTQTTKVVVKYLDQKTRVTSTWKVSKQSS